MKSDLLDTFTLIYLYNFYVCLAIFSLITIFGNAHRPCKQLSNITTPSLFFSEFFPISSSEIQKFTIFGNFFCSFQSLDSSAIPLQSIPGTVPVKLPEHQNSVAGVKFWLVNCGIQRGLYSAPLIPAGIRSFLRNPVDSGGMKFGRKACYFRHSGA